MTATATIQVAFVNAPQDGKNKGSIKTSEGEYFGVWANQIGVFRQGASYEIEYKERNWNGKTYRDVTKARPHDRPSVVNAAPHGAGSVSAQAGDGSQVIDQKSPAEYAEIHSVTSILVAKINTCQIGRDEDLVPHIQRLREQYRRGFGA